MKKRIITSIISFVFSIGVTLLIKPHLAVYISSDVVLAMLLLLNTGVGFAVIYFFLNKILTTKR
jgi:hypothetical protein